MIRETLKRIANKFLSSNTPLSRYSVRLKRHYRMKKFYKKERKVVEIGGGRAPISGENLNIDISDHHAVDEVVDLLDGLPFNDNEIDKIISIALLEHFNMVDIRKILREFYRVLKQGGELEISVPSLNKMFEYYKTYGCDDVLLRYMHGAQKDKYDIHLCVPDNKRLKEEFKKGGFKEVEELDYDYPRHQKDPMNLMMRIVGYKREM